MRGAGPVARSLTMTLALAVLGVVWVTVIDPPAAPRALRVGSSPAAAARPAAPAAEPATPVTARALLRAGTLALTTSQRVRLTSLAEGWDADMAPLEEALAAAAEAFSRFAREAQQAGPTRLAEVRARSEEVQMLSALVRERRARHAADALALLSESQRARITAARDPNGGPR